MEKSEILRPGFLATLKPGGIILMAETKIIPQGLPEESYPGDEVILQHLEGFEMIRVNVLKTSIELGDNSGRSANVVMLGALSGLPPFNVIPKGIWLNALKHVSPKPAIWDSNYAAFNAGIRLV